MRPARAGSEDRLAAGDATQDGGDLVLVGVLEKVATGAGAHGGEEQLVLLEHRQHDDTDRWVRRR